MKIYNTLTGDKSEFIPIKEGEIGMYICGVTVYDYCHVGHARAYISFDAIYRYLEYKGFNVNYVRNFTDVDDKIINRSNELNISSKELSEKYIDTFHEDMKLLKMKDAKIEPKATEHIDDMIELIQKLIKNGMAYESNGDVYYAVQKFSQYGKLSKRKLEELLAGARIEINDIKKNPLDFALWKSAKPNEPSWDSPWGKGRPGWHIECSAMSTKYLGKTFDIHGGGKDLVFPHHENEIAQAEGAFGQQYVNYWLHNGFVNIDGAKMSKSLGNFFTIRNLLEIYHPEVIRFFVLLNHYRSPINFTVKKIEKADGSEGVRFVSLDETEERLFGIYTTLHKMNQIINSPDEIGVNLDADFTSTIIKKFEEYMDDDFNTAAALGEFSNVIHFVNDIINKPKTKMKDKKATLTAVKPQIEKIASIFAVFDTEPKEFIDSITEKRLKDYCLKKEDILNLIEERKTARLNKNYQLSDEIRDKLKSMCVEIQDTPNGVEWCLQSILKD